MQANVFEALAQTGASIVFTLEPQAVAASLRNRRWLNMTKAAQRDPIPATEERD